MPAPARKHSYTEDEKQVFRTDSEQFLEYRKAVDGVMQEYRLLITCREERHIFDLILERNRMGKEASAMIIIDLGHQLVVHAWCLEHVPHRNSTSICTIICSINHYYHRSYLRYAALKYAVTRKSNVRAVAPPASQQFASRQHEFQLFQK